MGDRTKIDWCDASWNPVTMEPVGETERNETAEKWSEIEVRMAAEEKKAAETRARLRAEMEGQIPGQMSMEDLI